MVLKLPNGFLIECVGGYGKSSIYDLLEHYYDGIQIEKTEDMVVDVTIVLTEKGYRISNSDTKNPNLSKYTTKSLLLGPQTPEELQEIKLLGIPLFTVSVKQVYSLYKYLHFPIYEYINLGLILGAYKLSSILQNIELKNLEGKDPSKIHSLNLKDSYISICVEKNFSLRYSMLSEKIKIVYEPGKSELGVLLCMEWIRSFNCDVYTIFDIDYPDLENKSLVDFLIPFTTLGNLQKGFLIVNSDLEEFYRRDPSESPSESFDLGQSPESFDSEKSFDFSLYNTLMQIWNGKEYIPRRKKLAEPLPEFQNLRDPEEQSISIEWNSKPIFIIDSYNSVLNWIKDLEIRSEILSNSIFVYVGKRKKITF